MIEDDAKLDIAEAYDWYSKINQKVSASFLFQIKTTLDYLELNLFFFQLVYEDYRQVPVKRFPFAIIYKVHEQNVNVFRIFPTKMDSLKRFKVLK